MPSKNRRNSLKRLSDSRTERMRQDSEWFLKAMREVSASWQSQILDFLSRAREGRSVVRAGRNAANVAYLYQEVQGQLNRTGYDAKVRAILRRYDESMKEAVEALEIMGIKPSRVASVDSELLNSLKAMDYQYLAGVGQKAVTEIATNIAMNEVNGLSREKMITNVEGSLSKGFKQHATTYVDTSLAVFDRRATWDMWVAHGVKRFMYRGPNDIKTREWCHHKVGKTFSVKEIEKMENGQKGMSPVKYYGGGWNCRHIWSPDLE